MLWERRVQHRILRMDEIIESRTALWVEPHTELLVLVDRGDHRPDKGGIKSKAPGLDIGMEPGDSQLSRQSKAAVKAEKFLEYSPPGPNAPDDGRKQAPHSFPLSQRQPAGTSRW